MYCNLYFFVKKHEKPLQEYQFLCVITKMKIKTAKFVFYRSKIDHFYCEVLFNILNLFFCEIQTQN